MNEFTPTTEARYHTDRSVGHIVLEQDVLSLTGIAELTRLITNAHCPALVLSSTNTDFCRGRAPGGPRPSDAEQSRKEVIDPILELYRALGRAPFPIITAVNGRAHGLGFALAMSGDVVFADPEANFALPEINAGFPPLLALAQLSGTIAPKTLAHLALSTRPITARTLANAGSISVLAPGPELLPLAHDYAVQIADTDVAAREATMFVRERTSRDRENDFHTAREVLGDFLCRRQ